ncbi:MAG: 16S rRNA (uracil(1498)-N(3))-methyltransferase [Flavobacteriales bacterium]|nr:16S rRNA (uracil(1498)-N(3))-methyltransferase [Flavobacteriales bacterium]
MLIAIGPEGDFTRDEIEHALQNRYSAAELGSQRLRTETAGIYSAAVFASLFNEKM